MSPRPLGHRQAVDAFDAVGQLVLAPAFAAVLGTEHLTLAGGAIDAVRIGRALGDDHQRALHRHVVVEALPSLAEVAAAVERALVAHRGDAESGVHRPGVVPRTAANAGAS